MLCLHVSALPEETTRGMEMVGGRAVKAAPALSQLLQFEPKYNMLRGMALCKSFNTPEPCLLFFNMKIEST